MGDTTAIGWTNKTWNPWSGCTKVSPGCDNCYMFRLKKRWGKDPEKIERSKTTFRDPLRWKAPALVFTCSMSDFFHKGADDWRNEAWQIIRATPHLTYQVLTKRPGRILRHLPADWGNGYPNVWLGTSVESQDQVHRIRQLCSVPAALRFLSCEPLIGPLTIPEFLPNPVWNGVPGWNEAEIGWVIAGGESGPGCRPMELDWARRLRAECAIGGVPFFLKQLGGVQDARAHEKAVLDGVTHTAIPARPLVEAIES